MELYRAIKQIYYIFLAMLAPNFNSFPSKFSYPLKIYSIFPILVVPFAARADVHSAAPPLKSVDFTLAPTILLVPFIIAALPSN